MKLRYDTTFWNKWARTRIVVAIKRQLAYVQRNWVRRPVV